MIQTFASPSIQKTPGRRGRTTQRASTETVCGNDGAYCAMVKEELIAKPPVTMFRVVLTLTYPGIPPQIYRPWPMVSMREQAEAIISRSRPDPQAAATYQIEEVLTAWKMVDNQLRRVVIENEPSNV